MNDFQNHRGPSHSEEEQLRALFEDAVSGVEPRETIDSIRDRTTVTPLHSRRGWLFGAGAAVVASAAAVTAIAVVGGDPGTPGADGPGFANGSPSVVASADPTAPSDGATASGDGTPSGVPSSSPTDEPAEEPSATDTGAPAQTVTTTVPVYYVGDTFNGPRLYREFHQVEGAGGAGPELAVREAVAGTPTDGDYRSGWPAGTTVQGVHFDGVDEAGVLQVELANDSTDLSQRPAGMSDAEAQAAVQQLVYTVQGAAQTRAGVEVYLDGSDQPTDTLLGVSTGGELTQADPLQALSLVWIIDPAEGASVQAPVTVSGSAAAYEANVQWELKQGGEVVKSGHTMARECCTMAPYSFKVDVPPGEYTLVVHDSDASGRGQVYQDTKQITVTN